MLTLTKLEIAEHQLNRALKLFLDESDYVSATTLAGASEEILGKLVEREGKKNALNDFVDGCLMMGRALGEDFERKNFITMATDLRNGLKHLTDGQPLTVSREAAIEILNRAIENYCLLTYSESELMSRFRNEVQDV